MTLISDDVFQKVAKIIGGEDAIKVVMALKKLGEDTDDQILERMDLKLNDVRRILFKLYNHSVVQCDRSRDENTGWFIFRWRLQSGHISVKNLLRNPITVRLAQLSLYGIAISMVDVSCKTLSERAAVDRELLRSRGQNA